MIVLQLHSYGQERDCDCSNDAEGERDRDRDPEGLRDTYREPASDAVLSL